MKYLNDTGLSHLISKIKTLLGGKVDVVAGKGLSTNDYTTAEKTKLAGIEAGAQANVQSDWNATTGDAFIANKPTALSDFTNDENFITNAVNDLVNYYKKTETYTQAEVNSLISSARTGGFKVVATLPTAGAEHVGYIYLVPKTGAKTQNVKDEYICIKTSDEGVTPATYAWEKIGDTEIDLSAYRTAEAQDVIDAGKVDKVTGYGLSKNDYTDAEKTKLAGIEAGAEVNDIVGVASGSVLSIDSNKILQIDLSGYALDGHVHAISDVTGLQDALDAKLDESDLVAITNAEIDAEFAD